MNFKMYSVIGSNPLCKQNRAVKISSWQTQRVEENT